MEHRAEFGGAPSDRAGADEPTARNGKLVDFNHVVTAGMTTYPGLPGPDITAYLTRQASRDRYAPGPNSPSSASA